MLRGSDFTRSLLGKSIHLRFAGAAGGMGGAGLPCFWQTAGLDLQCAVLLVVHGFEPLVARVLTGEPKGQVAEPAVGGGAMPMLDVCRNLDDIAGVQALRGLALFLVPALAVDADQHLSAALACVVDMPVVAAARLKGDVVDGQVIVRGGQI